MLSTSASLAYAKRQPCRWRFSDVTLTTTYGTYSCSVLANWLDIML